MQVRAKEGDTLDRLCHQYLGSSAAFEDALALNPQLANHAIVAKGTLVKLPRRISAPEQKMIQLWD